MTREYINCEEKNTDLNSVCVGTTEFELDSVYICLEQLRLYKIGTLWRTCVYVRLLDR